MEVGERGIGRKENRNATAYLSPCVVSVAFVSTLTIGMVGTALFYLWWESPNQLPVFSTVVKHPPATYLWELSCHVIMPLWYLSGLANYLRILRVIIILLYGCCYLALLCCVVLCHVGLRCVELRCVLLCLC